MARKYLNMYNFENQTFAVKKLLLAPFLLASLFSFGGELKANPGSRYELPDPRSSLSESQSNSINVMYFLKSKCGRNKKASRENL